MKTLLSVAAALAIVAVIVGAFYELLALATGGPTISALIRGQIKNHPLAAALATLLIGVLIGHLWV